MVICYNPLTDDYIVNGDSGFDNIMVIEARSVREFMSMLGRQPEAYQLLAYIGYGVAKAATENDNPMLDALVKKYGGRFDR